MRIFRYELRRWRDGAIPDIAEAVDSPRLLTTDSNRAGTARPGPAFPTVISGLDELPAGEMWNSNSLIAWLLVRSGHHAGSIPAPAGGRARAGRPG